MAEEAVKPTEPVNNITVNEANPFETREPNIETVAPPAAEVKPPIVDDKPAEIEKPSEEKPVDEVKPKEVVEEKPTPSEIKFINENSKKLYELIAAGKQDEVYDILHEQRTLATVDKLSPEQQIKLNLKYQHPDYNDEEIEGLFSESFERPEKPEQNDDELDDEFKVRTGKWEKEDKKYQNKVTREAKSALKQLSSKKSELILPNIQKQEVIAPEPTAEEVLKQKKDQETYLKTIDRGVSEFDGYSTVFKDGAVEIPIKYTIDSNEKEPFKAALQNFNVVDYFRQQWMDKDNVFDGKKYAEDVYWLQNRKKILEKVATEAASRRLEDHLKEQKNIDYSGGRTVVSSAGAASAEDKMIEFMLNQR